MGAADIERVFRDEHGRVVASLVRRFRDIDVAEDAASEALLAALERWPVEGTPPNPGAWLTTTAGRKAIDRIRREQQRDAKQVVPSDRAPESRSEVHEREGLSPSGATPTLAG